MFLVCQETCHKGLNVNHELANPILLPMVKRTFYMIHVAIVAYQTLCNSATYCGLKHDMVWDITLNWI